MTDSSSSSPAHSFGGVYRGSVNGVPATLSLHQDEDALHGDLDAGGYRYTLAGTANSGTASGTLTDPQVGSAMPFELARDGEALTLVMVVRGPQGQVQRVPLSFAPRTDASPPQGSSGLRPPRGSGAEAEVERDPMLIGAWSYADTYVSGDFSGTTRLYLQVHPDGTYLYGNGEVAVGGSSAYGAYSGRSGGGDVVQGQWRTEGSILYVKEPGVLAWTPYARYYVEGPRMLLTFGDGARQVWTRR